MGTARWLAATGRLRTFRSMHLLLACLLVPACSGVDIAREVVSTADMFGRQKTEQASFLGTSTAMFYPQGVPEDVSKLPKLDAVQLRAIQRDLELQAKQLLVVLKEQQSLMKTVMGRPVSVPLDQKFQAQSLDSPDSFVNDKGVVVIDAKVVQGIYRGIALSAMGASTTFDAKSNREQQRALYQLIKARSLFLAANPSPTVETLKDVLDAVQPGRSAVEVAFSAFDSRLETVSAVLMSEKASKSYDDAVGFLIAHEIGHRALDHYARLKGGEPQRPLEEEADKFGSVLLVLARNSKVGPNNGFPAYIQGASMNSSFGGPWCFNDINHNPNGHEVFFQYGYALAGFDSMGTVDPSKYPTRAERAEATDIYSKAAFYGVSDAQDATGSCEYSWSERRAVAADEKKHLLELYELRSRRLKLAEADLKERPDSESGLMRQKLLRPLVAAVDVHDAVYLDLAARLR